MSGAVAVVVLLGAAIAVWVLRPLFRSDAAEAERIGAATSEFGDLRSRREMLVAALRDLEDDRATGKIDDADYAESAARLEAEAVAVMRQLDAIDRAEQGGAPVALPALDPPAEPKA